MEVSTRHGLEQANKHASLDAKNQLSARQRHPHPLAIPDDGTMVNLWMTQCATYCEFDGLDIVNVLRTSMICMHLCYLPHVQT